MRLDYKIKYIQKTYQMLLDMKEKYPKRFEREMNYIGESVIATWYDLYPRDKYEYAYDPYGSLYQMFRVNNNNGKCSVEFSSDFISHIKHHQNNDIIFNNSFIEGYHGGSWGEGIHGKTPHWRTPYPFFPNWDGVAAKSFSPYEEMYTQMTQQLDNIKKDFDKDKEKIDKRLLRLLTHK